MDKSFNSLKPIRTTLRTKQLKILQTGLSWLLDGMCGDTIVIDKTVIQESEIKDLQDRLKYTIEKRRKIYE